MGADPSTRRVPGHIAALPVAQIGFLVPDLRAALDAQAAPGRTWSVYEYGPEALATSVYRGEPTSARWLCALSNDEPQLELIELLEGTSIYRRDTMAGRFGLHHLGCVVESFPTAAAEMSAAGFEPTQLGLGHGADATGAFAYFDTEADLGYLLELIERPRTRREPLYVVSGTAHAAPEAQR